MDKVKITFEIPVRRSTLEDAITESIKLDPNAPVLPTFFMTWMDFTLSQLDLEFSDPIIMGLSR